MGKKPKLDEVHRELSLYAMEVLNNTPSGERSLVIFSKGPDDPVLVFGSCCRTCTDRIVALMAAGKMSIPLAPNDDDFEHELYGKQKGNTCQ